MHYPYRISRTQISFAASPRHDFPETHIYRKMLHWLPFIFPLKENWSDSLDTSIAKSILYLLAKETCLAKKLNHKRALVFCCILPICLQQLHYQNYLSQFQGSKDISMKSVYNWNALPVSN